MAVSFFSFNYARAFVTDQRLEPTREHSIQWLNAIADYIERSVHEFCRTHEGPMLTNSQMIEFAQTRLRRMCQETGIDWEFCGALRSEKFEVIRVRLLYRTEVTEFMLRQHPTMCFTSETKEVRMIE